MMAREFVAQFGQVLQSLADAIVGDIVGGGFSAQVAVVADILLDESVLVVAADDRVGEIEIFDHGLQFAGMVLLDLTAKDDADFIGLSNGAVGIDQPLTELIDGGAAREDQIVAIFDLGKEQPVFDSRLLSFTLGKEWGQLREPFAAAAR